MLIDDFMPRWDERERHERFVHASPEQVDGALRDLRGSDLPLTRLLMGIRTLLAPGAAPTAEPLLKTIQQLGFVVLAEQPLEEMVLGVAGRFWRPRADGIDPLDGPEAFHAYARPGSVKATWNFHLAPEDGGTRVVTETRISAIDANARRKFGLYWRIVMPGSALIRRELLRALATRAGERRDVVAPADAADP
jgi:hypothetical protein